MITRIITGIVGMGLAVYVIDFGSWLFSLTVLALAMLAWHEFARAFGNAEQKLSYLLGMAAIMFMIGCAWQGNSDETLAVLTVTTLLVMAEAVFFHQRFSIEQACVSLAGILYVSLPFSHLILLRFAGADFVLSSPLGNMTQGCALIWLAFLGTWASDTFAFFTGSFCGRHKLCPDISPNKTVEGFAGGMIGTVLVTAAVGSLFGFFWGHMIVLGILLAAVATLGDLVESTIKRHTGIKDSGSLIPGHGGVLDRFDSIMFTVPLVYYYVQIFNIIG
ncbi:MAG: phosphatidate cytidylyltransferase [Selenomonadaceae bacterium]